MGGIWRGIGEEEAQGTRVKGLVASEESSLQLDECGLGKGVSELHSSWPSSSMLHPHG